MALRNSVVDRLNLTSILSGYVPYTGATADVDLGLHTIAASTGTFNDGLSAGYGVFTVDDTGYLTASTISATGDIGGSALYSNAGQVFLWDAFNSSYGKIQHNAKIFSFTDFLGDPAQINADRADLVRSLYISAGSGSGNFQYISGAGATCDVFFTQSIDVGAVYGGNTEMYHDAAQGGYFGSTAGYSFQFNHNSIQMLMDGSQTLLYGDVSGIRLGSGSHSIDIDCPFIYSNGSHLFQFGSSAAPSIGFQGDSTTGVYRIASGTIGFTGVGTTRAVISAVGVGSGPFTTPAASFHAHATTAITRYFKATNSVTGALSTDGFDIGISTTGVAEIRQRENLSMQFFTNNAVVGTVTAAGLWGVGGNHTPAMALHVRGSGGTGRLRIENTSADPVLEMVGTSGTSYLFTRAKTWHVRTDSTTTHVKLQVGDSAATQGLVQIGNGSAADPTPTAQLTLRGNVNSTTNPVLDVQAYAGTSRLKVFDSGIVGINSASATGTQLDVRAATSNVGVMVRGNDTQDIAQWQNSGGTKLVWVTSSGDVSAVAIHCSESSGSSNVHIALRSDLDYIGVMSNHRLVWANASTGNFFSATIDTGMGRNAAGVVEVNNGTLGTYRDLRLRTLVTESTVRLKGYTVATLPAGTVGDTAYVTDALAPTFLTAVVGGGAVVTTVFYNGTTWVSA